MIREIVKDAFVEGREAGGEWEDSESKVVSEMFPFFDLENAKIRQRYSNGKFGKTHVGIGGVRNYVRGLGKNMNSSNFKAALFTGRKYEGSYWEIVK